MAVGVVQIVTRALRVGDRVFVAVALRLFRGVGLNADPWSQWIGRALRVEEVRSHFPPMHVDVEDVVAERFEAGNVIDARQRHHLAWGLGFCSREWVVILRPLWSSVVHAQRCPGRVGDVAEDLDALPVMRVHNARNV